MFLSMEGPPISMFNPSRYAQLWIARGHHAATDLRKCRQQKEMDVLPGQIAIWKCTNVIFVLLCTVLNLIVSFMIKTLCFQYNE